MAARDLRKVLHDELITDFTALTHSNGTDALFAEVQKIFLNFPVSLPVCQILVSEPTVEVVGISTDKRQLGFTSIVYDLIEQSATQVEADRKIDRLSDIEDQVMDYLEQIPHPIERPNANIHVANIIVNPSIYNYESSEQGVRVYQSISFTLECTIINRGL